MQPDFIVAHLSENAGTTECKLAPARVCWAMLILLGIGRTLSYEKFEWAEAAGSGQVAALALKHVLLVSLIIWGTIIQLRLRKFFKECKI